VGALVGATSGAFVGVAVGFAVKLGILMDEFDPLLLSHPSSKNIPAAAAPLPTAEASLMPPSGILTLVVTSHKQVPRTASLVRSCSLVSILCSNLSPVTAQSSRSIRNLDANCGMIARNHTLLGDSFQLRVLSLSSSAKQLLVRL
jgi:hypothetical protein